MLPDPVTAMLLVHADVGVRQMVGLVPPYVQLSCLCYLVVLGPQLPVFHYSLLLGVRHIVHIM